LRAVTCWFEQEKWLLGLDFHRRSQGLFECHSSRAAKLSGAPRPKVMVTGGHPGDPECGCGGTIARYTDLGHDVVADVFESGAGVYAVTRA